MKDPLLMNRLCQRLIWKDLDTAVLRQLIVSAREEDLKGYGLAKPISTSGDISTQSLIPEDASLSGEAVLKAHTELTVCGLPLIPLILDVYSGDLRAPCGWHPLYQEGDMLKVNAVIGTVRGPVTTLLQAERLILNMLQRLSGIATYTARCVTALGDGGTRLLDTRKTIPGWRFLEKYAVACGGGWNHRLGLFDRILIKDNHLAAIGATSGPALTQCIKRLRAEYPQQILEVEVDSFGMIEPVLAGGADILLLDNFSLQDLRRAVALIGDRAYTEASGGVTLETLPSLGTSGLDFISCGALTHQSPWVDIGMDWRI